MWVVGGGGLKDKMEKKTQKAEGQRGERERATGQKAVDKRESELRVKNKNKKIKVMGYILQQASQIAIFCMSHTILKTNV